MGAVVRLTADDGHVLNAYRAAPDGEPRAGLVLVQEIFGVNDHVRSVCDDYAAQGYLVLAPCLFDRKEPGIERGYTAETVDEGRGLKADIGWDGPVMDIKAGVDALEGAPQGGRRGLLLGRIARLACRLPSGDRRGGRLLRRPDRRVRRRDAPTARRCSTSAPRTRASRWPTWTRSRPPILTSPSTSIRAPATASTATTAPTTTRTPPRWPATARSRTLARHLG